MTKLKSNIFSHIKQYCAFVDIDICEDEIQSDLEDFLEKIDAPANLAGFAQIIKLVSQVSRLSNELSNIIQHELHLPPYIYEAFHLYRIKLETTFLNTEFYRDAYHKGWCQDHPFYVLLMKSNQYLSNVKSGEFLVAFIKQYFVTIDTLRDPELATKTSTREEEVCRCFRLLMRVENDKFDLVTENIPYSHSESSKEIGDRIDAYLDNQESTSNNDVKGYLRTLKHFFYNDWKPSREIQRNSTSTKRVPKRYKDPIALPIVGAQDDLFTLLPQMPLTPSSEGIDEDDFYPSQSFVVNNRDLSDKRDKTELLDTKIPFDNKVTLRAQIDVTDKVRRSHNMGIQNTQLLMPEEFYLLVNVLIKYGNQDSNREIAIVAWIMLLLSKSVSEAMDLVVFRDLSKKHQGLFIDANGKGWWHFTVMHSAKSRLDQVGLREIYDHAITSCPDFLVDLMTKNLKEAKNGPLFKENNAAKITEQLTHKLKKISDRHGTGRVSIRRLSNFVSYYINSTDVIDPIYIDFSYAVNLYTTRVARSYANSHDNVRCQQLNLLWKNVEQDVTRYSGEKLPINLFEFRLFESQNHSLGSSFTPTQESITKLVSGLTNRIINSTPSFNHGVEQIIHYHNAFTAYTAWMLLFGTGYRAAWNPLPSLALFLPSLNLMGISDKDDSDFSHSRIVAVPTVLKEQIKELKRHLGCLRGLLRILNPKLCLAVDKIVDVEEHVLGFTHSQATQWYKTIKNSRREYGPFFFIHRQHSTFIAKSLSPSELVKYCQDIITLPSNAGRHWLKSRLLEMNVGSELINFQMGHWQAGEVPLAHYSTLSHIDAINEIIPIIDKLFQEVGWHPLKSALS